MSLADQFRKSIEDSGLSLYAVAEGSGISYGGLYRFYHGQRDFRLESANKLASYFQMRLTRPKRPKGGA